MKSCPDGELWGVSACFDPFGTRPSLASLDTFSRGVRAQGLPLLIVELVFGDAPFRVPDSLADRVIRFRSDTVLWHKERLLNLGIQQLPAECRYVAWLDADIVFENDDWIAETVERLNTHAVVQPFETACWGDESGARPPRGLPAGVGEGHELPSMGKALADAADRRRALARYERHGHTGFAWAARREAIERHGLYDRAIIGGGDTINAHALAGDEDFLRGLNLYCRELAPLERSAIASWGRGIVDETAGRIGWTPGRVVHLFHGPTSARGYVERLSVLREEGFDPDRDIAPDEQGCWRWSSDKPALHRRVRDYFLSRSTAPDRRAAEPLGSRS